MLCTESVLEGLATWLFSVVYIISRCTLIFSFVGLHECVIFTGNRVCCVSVSNSLLIMQNVICQIVNILAKGFGCKGVLFFVIGPEGSGKTTLTKALVDQYDSACMIPFSKAISEKLSSIELQKNKKLAEEIRMLMAQRSKNIPSSFLFSTLRGALKKYENSPVVAIEGFLRMEDQCEHALDIVGEFFPDHVLVCVEAVCKREIAEDRAVKRQGHNDSLSIIQSCHKEYFGKIETIREKCRSWSHHVQVCANGDEQQTLDNLSEALSVFVEEIQKEKKVKTFSKILAEDSSALVAA